MDSFELLVPVFAAVEYSLIYLLAGGGLMGALAIIFVVRALGR